MAVYVTIKDYLETQNKVSTLKSEQKLALLLDFDKN
jgi:hypothetical protein